MSIIKGFFDKDRADKTKFTPQSNIPRSDTQSAVQYVMDNAENVGTVYAPTDAEYLTKALSDGLGNERVVTDTTTIKWDWSETGKASANWEHLGIEDLSDPGGDRGLFWDDSESAAKWFKLGGGLSFVGEFLSITDADLVAIKDAAFQQGDVLFHDGTTLNRLPAGTSGYVLRTKGPGANPEWEVVEVEADLAAAEAAKLAAQQAQAAAEQAQSNAETAEDGAEAAQLAAEQAQGLAETAQQGAEQAQGLAETAQQAAELAETNAETAETNAETAQQAAENAQGLAEAAQSAAENAQSYAQEWANKAEDSLVSAAAGGDESDDYSALHWASKAAASAQAAGTAETNAETAESNAEAAQLAAEQAQSAAESAQSGAEDAQTYAMEWANNDEDDPVSVAAGGDNSTTYSAKHWAAKAQAAAGSVGDPVPKALFDANTILKADTDNTPAALTVGEGTLVGRATGGSIAALNAATVRALLDLEVGTDVQAYSANLASWSAVAPSSYTTTADLASTSSGKGASLIGIQDAGGLITAANVEAALAEIAADVAALDAAVVLKGTWDASAGSFPGSGAAQAGWSYIVSVAGTVDGVAFVENDRVLAITDNASTSTYASNWHKLDYTDQVLSVDGKTGAVDLSGDYQPLNSNLTSWSGEDPDDYYTSTETDSAISSAVGALSSTYQPLDSDLTAIAALSTQAAGRSVLTLADPNGDRIAFWDDSAGSSAWLSLGTGLSISTTTLGLHAHLQAIAGLSATDGNIIVGNGSTFVAESGATARSSLGLGSIATQAADNVSITGGSVSGITELAIADGGTGASTAVGARVNLKIVTLDQSTYDGLTPDSDTLYFITDAA